MGAATAEVFRKPSGASKNSDIQLFDDWTGSYGNLKLFPSTVLYYGAGNLPTTGHDLLPLLHDPDPSQLKPERLFRLWKLMFRTYSLDALSLALLISAIMPTHPPAVC